MAGIRDVRFLRCKFITAAAVFIALALNMGCGDFDVLNEAGSRYHTSSITVDDSGSSTLDVVTTTCTAPDVEPEDTGWVTLTVTSDEDMETDGYFYALRINITPDLTSLPDFTLENVSCQVDALGGSCEYSLGLFPPTIKTAIVAELGPAPFTIGVQLTPLITYTIQDIEKNYEAPTVSTGVAFGEVDNCPSGT